MTRICAGLVVGLVVGAGARADDPKPKSDPRPPYERLLKGEDAKKAAELEATARAHERAGRYDEAVKARDELTALRADRQGADHWEAVEARCERDAARAVTALPADRRAAWVAAFGRFEAARRLAAQGQYIRAEPGYEEFCQVCERELSKHNLYTTVGWTDVAINLHRLGRVAEAAGYLRRVLDLRREMFGEQHPRTATAYHNLAGVLTALGGPADAEPLFRKALEARLAVLGERHADTAGTYKALADNLHSQARDAAAHPLYETALRIRLEVLGERHRDTARSYQGLAVSYHSQGRYAEAEPLFQKAVDLERAIDGERHPEFASALAGLAANAVATARDRVAEDLYRQVVEIRQSTLGPTHPATARSLTDLAASLDWQKRFVEAEPYYRRALEVARERFGPNHTLTALCAHGLACNLAAQRKYAEAQDQFRAALDVNRELLGEYHRTTAQDYKNLAANLAAQGLYADARREADRATAGYEASRLTVADRGAGRATYGHAESPYQLQASVCLHLEAWADAWAAIEADLARAMADESSARQGDRLTPAEREATAAAVDRLNQIQGRVFQLVSRAKRTEGEAEELNRLKAERGRLEARAAELAVAVSRRDLAPLAAVRAALPADAALVLWVDGDSIDGAVQEHFGCVVRADGPPRWESLPGTGPAGRWTADDKTLPVRFRQAVAAGVDVAPLADGLRAQRLAPLDKHLSGVKRVYAVSAHEMAGVPVEALTDKYTVSYVPSGTFLARLADRPRPAGHRLLAVGDPTFPPPAQAAGPAPTPPGGLLVLQVVPGSAAAAVPLQAGDVLLKYAGAELKSVDDLSTGIDAHVKDETVPLTVWRAGKDNVRDVRPGDLGVILAHDPAPAALAARVLVDAPAGARGGHWAELPGTRVEVERLRGLFGDRATVLAGSAASEQELDALRAADRLREFRYLHFATHGVGNNVRAFESALILAQDKLPKDPLPRAGQPLLDGKLSAAEVLEFWKLDADLVTLSACETAVGRAGGGDGLLGFAQAFLVAGSRSVCLTLWKVDDTAACLLMDRFYRNLLGKREDGAKPLGKAAALREAKDWLRGLSRKDAEARLGALARGVVRGEAPAGPVLSRVPRAADDRPYAHPKYWAAFVLIGDPD